MSADGADDVFDPADPTLQIEDLGEGVALARIRRPPNNFFDERLIAALATETRRLADDDSARVIVLCSEGTNFCAGADFSRKGPRSGREFGIYSWALDLFDGALPIVAAVQGAAVGGGAGLALAADIRVGTDTTRFTLNFSTLGINQGFALTETLREVLGEQQALRALITGATIAGPDALAAGLLDELVPPEKLEDTAIETARRIAEQAPLAVREIRALVRSDRPARLRHAIERESAAQARLMRTEDFREGVRATADRRKPLFQGK